MQTRKIGRFPRWTSWVLAAFSLPLFQLAALSAAQTKPAPAAGKVLHTIREVYSLPVEQAKLGNPIDLEAIVTYSDAEWGMIFVRDDLGYSYIDTHGSKTNFPAGTRVRVRAVTGFDGYTTSISKPKITFLSAGAEVTPVPKTVAELDAGGNDSQLVVTEGVLHPCIGPSARACFRVVVGKQEVILHLREPNSPATDRLVGATVRVRGVAATAFDSNGKRSGAQLLLEGMKQIEVKMPPLAANSAAVTVQSLRPEDAELTLVRQVHLRGRVNWSASQLFTLQDETGTIFVGTVTPVVAHIGDPVDVIGFPFHGRFGLELRDSSVQVTTDHLVPVKIAALNTTVEEILKNSLNGRRVHLRARLESREETPAQITFHFSDQGQPFTALLLPGESPRKIAAFPKGSTLEMLGVEMLQSRGKNAPASMLVLIESPDDLILRPGENWLTWQRALVILGFTALCVLLPLIWVKQLKRTVRKQMAINREQLAKEFRLASKYQRLFERNLAAVYSLRPSGVITECNAAFLKLLGLDDLSQLRGRSYWEFEVESDRQEDMKNSLQTGMLSNSEATLRRDDGAIVYLLKNVSPVETPEGVVYEITAIDVTQMRRHQFELQHSRDTAVMKSLIDPLTELPNRRMLMESLPEILERTGHDERSLALLFIDLDGFKPVNDTMGHAAGDEVLIHIANTMRSMVRKGDSLARLGGDEFMLVLCDLGARENAVRVAEDLRHAIDRPIRIQGQLVHVSASIGISIFPADATQAEELIVRADRAMYAAKRQGKNRFLFYSDKMEEAEVEEQEPAVQP